MPARCRLKQFIWKKYATRSKLLPPIDTLLYDALLDLKLDVAWWAIKKGASSTRWNNMPLRMAIECKDGCFVNYLVTEKHVPNSILEIRHASKH